MELSIQPHRGALRPPGCHFSDRRDLRFRMLETQRGAGHSGPGGEHQDVKGVDMRAVGAIVHLPGVDRGEPLHIVPGEYAPGPS